MNKYAKVANSPDDTLLADVTNLFDVESWGQYVVIIENWC